MDGTLSQAFSHLIVCTVYVIQRRLIVFPLIWSTDSIMIYRRTKQTATAFLPFITLSLNSPYLQHLLITIAVAAAGGYENQLLFYCIIFSCQVRGDFSLWHDRPRWIPLPVSDPHIKIWFISETGCFS